MKYLKIFEKWETVTPETIIGGPQIGDYVICFENGGGSALEVFVSKNIGLLIDIKMNTFDVLPYIVEYNHIPNRLKYEKRREYNSAIGFSKDNIKHWSKNKEELEVILASNKYNL